MTKNIRSELYDNSPYWASELISGERYQDPTDPYREAFMASPDDQRMHSKWHQWGILHHMVMAGEAFDNVVPELIEDRLDPGEKRFNLLAEDIDNTSKWDLLGIAVATHDYGKFTRRQLVINDRGPVFNFGEHEAESGSIIRSWQQRFNELGLTNPQVEYVARCAELHYELGKLRQASKHGELGYTIAFTSTQNFAVAANCIARDNPDFKREIGLIFLADSLAKTDIHLGLDADTDEQNEALIDAMEENIAIRGLSRRLIPAAKQVAINISVGIAYLNSITA